MLPLVLPPVAIGVFLLALLGRGGLGILSFVGTWRGARSPRRSSRSRCSCASRAPPSRTWTRAWRRASVLGASPRRVFFTVTLPLAARGLVAATVLAFARALGEFGATIVVAGAVRGETETLPIAIFRPSRGGARRPRSA